MLANGLSLRSRNSRNAGLPNSLPSNAAWYDVSDITSLRNNAGNIPSSGDGIKLISDKSGNSGTNAFVSSGAASNTATTATKSITGSVTITADVRAADYTPSANHTIFSKLSGNDGIEALLLTTGVLRLRIGDGASITNVDSTAACGVTDLARATLGFIWTDGVGGSFTVNGSALGTSVAAVKTLTNAATTATIGTSFAGVIYRVQVGAVYDFNPSTAAKLATSVTDGVSGTWTINTSGDLGARICGERDLYQGTVANQPIYLPWSGTNYGWLNGVAGGYFSTPDSAGVSVTGDIDLRWTGTLSDWTPDSECSLIAKSAAAGSQYSYVLVVRTTGALRLYVSLNGNTYAVQATSTASVSFTDGSRGAVRATRNSTTGDCVFYTSTDGSSWVQLGDTVAAAPGAIFDGTAVVEVGSLFTGTVGNAQAIRHERAQVLNGIGGTVVADFNPALYTSGTTFTASTGEVWTLNGGSTIVTRSCLYFDGTSDYMKAAAFSLSQPETVYFVGSQVTWTSGDYLFDGNAANGGAVIQTTGTPQLNLNAGSSVAGNTGLAVATNGVLAAVFNGASSALRVNRGAATTGNAGAGNLGGFILGASGTPGNYANITFSEAALYAAAHDTATQDNVIVGMGARWGISV